MQYRFRFLLLSVVLALGSFFTIMDTFSASSSDPKLPLCVVPVGESVGPYAACRDVFTSIQMAVDTAVTGDTLLLAAGTYTHSHLINGHKQLVYINKDLTIRGGYLIPFIEEPTPDMTPSHLHQPIKDDVRIIYIDTGTSVVLDGLAISGGNGESQDERLNGGGGIFIDTSHVTIQNSHIFSNVGSLTFYGHYHQGRGGGLLAIDSTVTVTHSLIEENIADMSGNRGFGGGLAFENSTYFLLDNEIFSNTASTDWSYGGGVVAMGGNGRIVGNTFTGNTAAFKTGFGGGLFIYSSPPTSNKHILIENNTFNDNYASSSLTTNIGADGGAFYISSQGSDSDLFVTIRNNTIFSNSSKLGGGGGEIIGNNREKTVVILEGNQIFSNTVSLGQTGHGPGLVLAYLTTEMNDNLISGNHISATVGYGGGVHFEDVELSSRRNKYVNNTISTIDLGYGGAIAVVESTMQSQNDVMIDNAGPQGSAVAVLGSTAVFTHPTISKNVGDSAIYLGQSRNDDVLDIPVIKMVNSIIADSPTAFHVEYNGSVEVNSVLWHNVPIKLALADGTASIMNTRTGDPLFAADGYHILSDSPAMGQGIETGVLNDIDNEGRPSPPTLGADEYLPPLRTYLPIIVR